MKNSLISIIVTCYNNEKYLEECLLSIQNQTYKNFEALLINDGSTDSSLEIMQKFASKDQRFKIFDSKHVGFPLAKNIGLDNATGDYIIFLDSDDVAYPYWLEMLYVTAVISKAPITTCLYDKFITPNKAAEQTIQEAFLNISISEFSYTKMNFLFHYDCQSYMWNKLIRKDLYNNIRHVDQIALSDFSVMYKIFEKADKIIQIKQPLVHYRQHEESMTTTTHKRGKDYVIFRFNLFKKVLRHVFDKYPQARYVIQIVLAHEIRNAKAVLGPDFNTLVSLEDVQDILRAETIHILI